MLNWITQLFNPTPTDPTAALVRKLTKIAGKEANAIDDLFAKNKVHATVDRSKVSGSDTGGFVRYPLRNEGKVSAIKALETDLAVCISALRGEDVTPILHLPRLVLELPYPLGRLTLAWEHASVSRLQEFQALIGMDYATLNVKMAILDWQNAASSNLLVSGETGSGKTNGLLGIILSLATSTSPAKAHVIVLDPKFSPSLQQLRGLPHVAVYNEPEDITQAITAVKAEINRRKRFADKRKIFLVVEEISELMIETDKDSKQTLIDQLKSIAQVGRELGVHLIACTQKATVTVIDTVLRSNLPDRLAFKVGTQEESRVALGQDGVGAERLPGLGAAYYVHNGPARRLQTYFIDDVAGIVEDVSRLWVGVTPYRIAPVDVQPESGLPEGVDQDQIGLLLSVYTLDQLLDSAKGYDWRHGYQKKAIQAVFGETKRNAGIAHDWAKSVLPVLQKLAETQKPTPTQALH